jgi:hypothetical protein
MSNLVRPIYRNGVELAAPVLAALEASVFTVLVSSTAHLRLGRDRSAAALE